MSETQAGKEYVCGFMFDQASFPHVHCRVLLIEKQRPLWQRLLLNGIGGEIEPGETPAQAMMREFAEETGINFADWKYFCKLGDRRDWTIHFFYAVSDIDQAKQMTDEKLIAFNVGTAFCTRRIIPNLRWLVPMAFRMAEERCAAFEIVEVKPNDDHD